MKEAGYDCLGIIGTNLDDNMKYDAIDVRSRGFRVQITVIVDDRCSGSVS